MCPTLVEGTIVPSTSDDLLLLVPRHCLYCCVDCSCAVYTAATSIHVMHQLTVSTAHAVVSQD